MTLPKRLVHAVRVLEAVPDLSAPGARAALDVLVDYADKDTREVERKAEAKAQREERQGPKPKRTRGRHKPDPPELVAGKAVVRERSGGLCEAEACDDCTGRLERTHHRRGRLVAEDHHPDLLLGCCNPCHLAIHANPERSYERGWMLSRLGTVRP